MGIWTSEKQYRPKAPQKKKNQMKIIILKTYIKHQTFDVSGPLSVEFPAVENTKQTKDTFSEAISDKTLSFWFK